MQQFTYFAAANYNCQGASDSSYGAGGYGTCETSASSGGATGGATTGSTQPGAPNTGDFYGFVSSGAFSILLPLVVALALVTAATLVVIRKKQSK